MKLKKIKTNIVYVLVCICHHSSLLDGPKAINEDVHLGLNWDA